MRGSLKKRYKGSWSLILDLGYQPDPQDPTKRRRKQKWITFTGTRKQADAKLTQLLHQTDTGTFVEPSKMTLATWLPQWLALNQRRFATSTYIRYKGIIEKSILTAPLATMPLQQIRASHIEAYYASMTTVSATTLMLHHAILHRALRKAVKDQLITSNPAVDLDGKPRRARSRSADAQQHCWSAAEARRFLAIAMAAGPQPAAFYALALDAGARKGELCGLRWSDLQLENAKVRIERQLLKPGPTPIFGPPKTGHARTVSISAETVALLRAHKLHQAELKMANRTVYQDHGLVFAKEWADVGAATNTLGHPLQANNLGQREYAKLIAAAGVRRIKFHGLRHTCATLLLQARQPVHVVSERLGHAKVSMTMETYAHVLPDMQRKRLHFSARSSTANRRPC